MDDPMKSIKYLTEVEALAEEILADRQEIIALDDRRNKTRVALREVNKSEEDKCWITVGTNLIKVSTAKAKEILEKDSVTINADINILQSNLKIKVNKLRDLEYMCPVPGLTLKPLSEKEIDAFKRNV